MAVAAYFTWDRLGRPLEPARPIREFVEGLREAFPRAEHLFSWYADDAHYEADYPQDHTPYSATGWPLASPQWVVFATDVMHRPELGVDCDKLFPYWLAEAKAGRMRWLKYMIYKATVYDVRYGWKPQPSSGHDKHIHLSVRTDHEHTSLGDWSITGDIMPDPLRSDDDFKALIYRASALFSNADEARYTIDGKERVETNQLKAALAALQAPQVDASAVADALAGNAGFLAALAKAVNDDAASRLRD